MFLLQIEEWEENAFEKSYKFGQLVDKEDCLHASQSQQLSKSFWNDMVIKEIKTAHWAQADHAPTVKHAGITNTVTNTDHI